MVVTQPGRYKWASDEMRANGTYQWVKVFEGHARGYPDKGLLVDFDSTRPAVPLAEAGGHLNGPHD